MNAELIWQGVGGVTGVGIVVWVMKVWAVRIEKELENKAHKTDLQKKADIDLCNLKHAQIETDMRKGDIRFERIESKLDKLSDASQNTHIQLERIIDAVIK